MSLVYKHHPPTGFIMVIGGRQPFRSPCTFPNLLSVPAQLAMGNNFVANTQAHPFQVRPPLQSFAINFRVSVPMSIRRLIEYAFLPFPLKIFSNVGDVRPSGHQPGAATLPGRMSRIQGASRALRRKKNHPHECRTRRSFAWTRRPGLEQPGW